MVWTVTMLGFAVAVSDFLSEFIDWYKDDDVLSSPDWHEVYDMDVNNELAERHIISDVNGSWAEELYRSIQQARTLPKQRFQPLGYENTYLVRC